ncbi:hypothetical protein B0H13DRAFT_757943 [Mycena leptocephala]|nr:hypothetical protein B0H13DRAFT_757943 [Mycena leptocephala]
MFSHGDPEEIKTGTFVIYSCHDETTVTPEGSFTMDDLNYVQANMGIGGCLMSIHEPAEAASWIEDNWDNSFLASIQNSDCGGPFACMLSPTEPALAIFGHYDNPVVVNIAESLAGLSGFPVLIRPLSDNPALTLLSRDVDPYCTCSIRDTAGNNDQRSSDNDNDDEAMVDGRTPADSGDGGRRNDDRNNTGNDVPA